LEEEGLGRVVSRVEQRGEVDDDNKKWEKMKRE
jgi:hypothetical protein